MQTNRMVTVKTESGIPGNLKDIISMQIQDNKIEAVIVKVGDEAIRIVRNGTYTDDLKVLKEQPKKEVKKYKVFGTVLSTTIEPVVFLTEQKALDFKYSLESKVNFDQSELEITQVVEFVDEETIGA